MYVDSHSGILRTFYATLSLITTKLPVLNLDVPSFETALKDAQEKNEAVDKIFDKVDEEFEALEEKQ